MIISSSAHETRVAILEEDQVAEVFIERERSRGVVGNLYKGRVSKVLPGTQSAFVDLGRSAGGVLETTPSAGLVGRSPRPPHTNPLLLSQPYSAAVHKCGHKPSSCTVTQDHAPTHARRRPSTASGQRLGR